MKKILIIEDDLDTADILGLIAGQLNAEIITFHQLPSLADVENLSPNIILLDHWVGQAFGGDLCTRLKADSATRHIPVILLSAHINLEQIARDSCADTHIAKPFDVDELLVMIKTYLK